MVITKITLQQKDTQRANIFIDGTYELSLTIDQVLEQKLKVGVNVDELALKRLRKLSEDGKVQARALEWCLSRPRSSKELRDYLYKKGASQELSDSICHTFALKKYQDDDYFTKWWIENRVRKNKSNLSIKTELKQKGINDELITKNLQVEITPKIRLKNLIVLKRLQTKYPDENKLKQYLAGKGFYYSDIVEVLAELKEGA
ncbi:MAG: RecX family transcriptional regulator [Candidatus Saccharimonadales bacterium]